MFNLIERKQEFERLVTDHNERMKKIKTPQAQYLEDASILLSCTAKTETVSLIYIENHDDDKKRRDIYRSSKQKEDGWFQVNLQDDCKFLVKEADLLNDKVYMIKRINMQEPVRKWEK